MAEGGYDPDEVYRNTLKQSGVYDNDDKETLDTTQPFETTPQATSTPYHRGEQVEMKEVTNEQQSGKEEPSFAETPFGGDERAPLIEKNSVEDIERRLSQLRNPTTGLLNISEIPNPKEDFLPEEFKNEQIEKANRMIRSHYPRSGNWVFQKEPPCLSHQRTTGWRNPHLSKRWQRLSAKFLK